MAFIARKKLKVSNPGSDSPALQRGKGRKTKPFLRTARRLLFCAAGAAIGLGLTLALTGIADPFLLASLGGTTVFLFGLTRTPAAQPRALFGGHLGGALIGIVCYQLFGDAMWVYVLAVVLTLVYMLLTQTVHPPAGANPLLMVHQHASFSVLWEPVGLSVLVLAAVAFAWTRIVPGMVRYPVKWMDASPPNILGTSWEND